MRIQTLPETLNSINAMGNPSLAGPHRVLVVGCAYGGVSAIVNLMDLEKGKARQPVYPGADFGSKKSRNGIEITVIDARDGYCMFPFSTALVIATAVFLRIIL
jgi:hypothetical protein